jgi:hypothetical protein
VKGGAGVVLGDEVWREHFAADSVRRRPLDQDGRARCGRSWAWPAPGFRFPANTRTDVIVPDAMPAQAPAQRKNGWTFAVGRLAPGVVDGARGCDDLTTISRQMEREHPGSETRARKYFALTVRDWLVGDTSARSSCCCRASAWCC